MGVSYQGTNYHGWQRQDADNLPTVQLFVEEALSRVADHPIQVVCAGRTDAGVHACTQVIHFDSGANRSAHAWVYGANTHLPRDISMLWAQPVSNDFHARFSAESRRYRYVIYDQPIRPALLGHGVGWSRQSLDVTLMQQAANDLLGEHDFSAFRGADCQSHSPVRTLQSLRVRRMSKLIVVDIQANAFLLHMVRNIIGVLVPIGAGTKPVSWAKLVLMSADRRCGGVTFSPNGLYFTAVDYPSVFDLPSTESMPYFMGGL